MDAIDNISPFFDAAFAPPIADIAWNDNWEAWDDSMFAEQVSANLNGGQQPGNEGVADNTATNGINEMSANLQQLADFNAKLTPTGEPVDGAPIDPDLTVAAEAPENAPSPAPPAEDIPANGQLADGATIEPLVAAASAEIIYDLDLLPRRLPSFNTREEYQAWDIQVSAERSMMSLREEQIDLIFAPRKYDNGATANGSSTGPMVPQQENVEPSDASLNGDAQQPAAEAADMGTQELEMPPAQQQPHDGHFNGLAQQDVSAAPGVGVQGAEMSFVQEQYHWEDLNGAAPQHEPAALDMSASWAPVPNVQQQQQQPFLEHPNGAAQQFVPAASGMGAPWAEMQNLQQQPNTAQFQNFAQQPMMGATGMGSQTQEMYDPNNQYSYVPLDGTYQQFDADVPGMGMQQQQMVGYNVQQYGANLNGAPQQNAPAAAGSCSQRSRKRKANAEQTGHAQVPAPRKRQAAATPAEAAGDQYRYPDRKVNRQGQVPGWPQLLRDHKRLCRDTSQGDFHDADCAQRCPMRSEWPQTYNKLSEQCFRVQLLTDSQREAEVSGLCLAKTPKGIFRVLGELKDGKLDKNSKTATVADGELKGRQT